MIPTYVLDTGALVCAERGKERVARFFRLAQMGRAVLIVPFPVVAEWWRGQRGHIARLLDALHIEPLSASLARLVGETMARVPRATLVDTVVIASAASRGDLVLTADIEDLTRIRDAAFPSVRVRRVV